MLRDLPARLARALRSEWAVWRRDLMDPAWLASAAVVGGTFALLTLAGGLLDT